MGGNQQATAYWTGREQAFQEVLHRANRAALEYLQAWAGITRTGYHGTRIDGREPGRFEEAGLVVTSWLQGTSRDATRRTTFITRSPGSPGRLATAGGVPWTR
jgi:hypothetical protein